MKATLRHSQRLTDCTLHHAFTDICAWQGHYYCAYRMAQTHAIVPKGHIEIQMMDPTGGDEGATDWRRVLCLEHPHGDLRDPKFLVTDDVLYLMCGIYLPHPALRHLCDGVLLAPPDNILQTHLTYTTDGTHWSALTPILRPNYWGWSGVWTGGMWVIATYHTGSYGEPSSIALWTGASLQRPMAHSVIYEGASVEREGRQYRYKSTLPCEPVCWYDGDTGFLGCAVRTDADLHLGYGKPPYDTPDWRWHMTGQRIHASAVLQTHHGWLLAGRAIRTKRAKDGKGLTHTTGKTLYETYTCLYALEGHTLQPLLTLPSRGDTGYCGIVMGPDEDTVLLSFYAQHEIPLGLPGAAVYVATVALQA